MFNTLPRHPQWTFAIAPVLGSKKIAAWQSACIIVSGRLISDVRRASHFFCFSLFWDTTRCRVFLWHCLAKMSWSVPMTLHIFWCSSQSSRNVPWTIWENGCSCVNSSQWIWSFLYRSKKVSVYERLSVNSILHSWDVFGSFHFFSFGLVNLTRPSLGKMKIDQTCLVYLKIIFKTTLIDFSGSLWKNREYQNIGSCCKNLYLIRILAPLSMGIVALMKNSLRIILP